MAIQFHNLKTKKVVECNDNEITEALQEIAAQLLDTCRDDMGLSEDWVVQNIKLEIE